MPGCNCSNSAVGEILKNQPLCSLVALATHHAVCEVRSNTAAAFFPSFRELEDHGKHVKPYRKFDNDCRKGELPNAVFIDPNSSVISARSGLNDDDQAPSEPTWC